jgi:hypothetical protein
MKVCACGCGVPLKPGQARWANGNLCKNAWNKKARLEGEKLLTGKRRGNFHYRDIQNSAMLQKVLAFVLAHPLCTNHDLINGTGTTRPPSDISEINANFTAMKLPAWIEAVDYGRTDTGARLTKWTVRDGHGLKERIEEWRKLPA